jgi:hypothetical protein
VNRATTDTSPAVSSGGRLLLYWTVVGVPLGWGIYNTVLKLQALFG